MEEIVEKELRQEVSRVEELASRIVITNDDQYRGAGEFLKLLKRKQKEIEAKVEPMWRRAYDAYKEVNNFKADVLNPFKAAEKGTKNKMASYTLEVERKRKEEEERIRAAAREEAARKMREADEAILAGDEDTAEMAKAEASVMAAVSETTSVAAAKPEVSGVSTRKDWRIVSIDSSKVPVDVAGVELRPVDQKAVMALIRGTKGKVTIPGVVYEESLVMAVRG